MNEDDFDIGSCSHSELMALLDSDDIQPGSQAGYQTCKTVYLYHPLGGKMVDRPIKMAMNEPRTIHVAQSFGLEQRLRDAFEREWKALGANQHIANAARIARIYGVSAVAMLVDNQQASEALDYRTLYKHNISFNILDPLNTAGSIVLNQIQMLKTSRKSRGSEWRASRITNHDASLCRMKTLFIWRITLLLLVSMVAAFIKGRCSR